MNKAMLIDKLNKLFDKHDVFITQDTGAYNPQAELIADAVSNLVDVTDAMVMDFFGEGLGEGEKLPSFTKNRIQRILPDIHDIIDNCK